MVKLRINTMVQHSADERAAQEKKARRRQAKETVLVSPDARVPLLLSELC